MIMHDPPPGKAHSFDTLNALRGVAAVAILCWHFPLGPGVQQDDIWAAYLAVDLFFLLSGVVIAHAYEAKLTAGWHSMRFMLARLIRLWPLYLLGTAIGFCAVVADAVLSGAAPWMLKPILWTGVQGLALFPSFDHTVLYPFNAPAWSLCYEVVVNIGYGAIGFRLSSRALAAISAVAFCAMVGGGWSVVELGVGLNLGATPAHAWIGLARAVFAFPIGVILYRAWRAGRLPQVRVPPMLLVGVLVLALFAEPDGALARLLVAIVLVAVAWPLLVGAAMQVEPVGWQLGWALRLAALSYPLYAIHDAVYLATGIIAKHAGVTPWPVHLAGAGASVVLAILATRYFDSPVRRVLTRWLVMPRTAPNAAPAL